MGSGGGARRGHSELVDEERGRDRPLLCVSLPRNMVRRPQEALQRRVFRTASRAWTTRVDRCVYRALVLEERRVAGLYRRRQ